jgi:hypothetical protein
VGWFTLAVLGVLWAQAERHAPLPRWLPSMSLALLLAPTFVLGVSPALLPPHLFWLAAAANAGAACLLAVHLVLYGRRLAAAAAGSASRLQWPGLASLAVVIVVAFALLLPGVWEANAAGPMRIFYLHDLLLGFASTMLLALIGAQIAGRAAWRWAAPLWAAGVGIMLLALLLFGLAGNLPLAPLSLLQTAAWASAPAALAAALLCVASAGRWASK